MQGLTFEQMLPLLEDEKLGAGNFVEKAYEASPNKDQGFIFVDSPYTSISGNEYHSFSLQNLVDLTREIASFYFQNGIKPRDVVAVYTEDNIENFLNYIAINNLGAIPAFINGALEPRVVKPYLQGIKADAVYTDIKRMDVFDENFLNSGENEIKVWTKKSLEGTVLNLPKFYPFKHGDTDPVLLTHTSGTTGIPKTSQTANIPLAYGLKQRLKDKEPMEQISGLLNMLPHTHAASILYLMEATLRGCRILVQTDKTPEGIITAIEDFKPDYVLSFPINYVNMLRYGIEGRDLSSVFYWRSTGDAAHEKHIRMLCEQGSHINEKGYLVPGSKYMDGLGSTEFGSPVFTTVRDSQSENYLRCVGKASFYSDVKVFDKDGNDLGANQVGLLGVKSPTVIKGYWNNSKKTEQSRIDGYQTTGDLVYFDANGFYYHLDRDSDTIETPNGTIYSLYTEEIIMRHFKEVFDCALFKRVNDEGAISAMLRVEPDKGYEDIQNLGYLLGEINACLADYNIPNIAEIEINKFNEKFIPLGVTGKVLKRQLRVTDNNWNYVESA